MAIIMHISRAPSQCASVIPQGSHPGVGAEILLQELGIGWQKCCTGVVLFQFCPKEQAKNHLSVVRILVGRQHWCHWRRVPPVSSPEPMNLLKRS